MSLSQLIELVYKVYNKRENIKKKERAKRKSQRSNKIGTYIGSGTIKGIK